MAGEGPEPQDKFIQVEMQFGVTAIAEGNQLQGVGFKIDDEPHPTTIGVFFNGGLVRAQNPTFSLDMHGEVEGVYGKNGELAFVTREESYRTTLNVHTDGRIVFEYNPRPEEQQTIYGAQDIQRSRALPAQRENSKRVDYMKKFSEVSIDDPSTFEPLTFGEALGYFRQEAGLVQRALAVRANIDPAVITRFERGIKHPGMLKTLTQILEGFEWAENDPRVQILTEKYHAEANARPSRRRG